MGERPSKQAFSHMCGPVAAVDLGGSLVALHFGSFSSRRADSLTLVSPIKKLPPASPPPLSFTLRLCVCLFFTCTSFPFLFLRDSDSLSSPRVLAGSGVLSDCAPETGGVGVPGFLCHLLFELLS